MPNGLEKRSGAALPLGRLLVTPGALRTLRAVAADPTDVIPTTGRLLARHAVGDWGDVDADDWRANDRAPTDGTCVHSAYHLPSRDGTLSARLRIITEADRTYTVLRPDEY